ncbi:MAG: RNA-binding S4 domain-containing protein [Armatimonadetes bacterium]|nr:RNA-binding S4 domain-containing protein [Armatimonadota bacterium]
MTEVPLRTSEITLGQLLKFIGIIPTGGEIKTFLMETSIKVNGLHENRRGRKLTPGDVVEVEGHESVTLLKADM